MSFHATEIVKGKVSPAIEPVGSTNSDISPPVITPSDDLIYQKGTSGNTISWILEDDFPGFYELYRNETQLSSAPSWADGQNLSFNVDMLEVGIYNYTIVATDVFENRSTSSIWVTVIEIEETSVFFWFSILILFFIPFISKRRKK